MTETPAQPVAETPGIDRELRARSQRLRDVTRWAERLHVEPSTCRDCRGPFLRSRRRGSLPRRLSHAGRGLCWNCWRRRHAAGLLEALPAGGSDELGPPRAGWEILELGLCRRGHTITGPVDVEVRADRIRCAQCVDDASSERRPA